VEKDLNGKKRIDGRTLRYQHRRPDLLEAVGDYVLDHGVASLSLRGVAKAVGVSHVTLQHHFGTKDQLVGEIVEHLLERTFTPHGDYSEMRGGVALREMWERWNSPAGQRDIRLFIEVTGQGLYDEAGYSVAVRHSIEHRLQLIADRLTSVGCPEEDARAYATVVLALLRGLMIDMLVTGDRERLDDAFEIVLVDEAFHARSWREGQPAGHATADA
jgi:AcrR family transcriptional regulator